MTYGRNFGGRWEPRRDGLDFGWTPPPPAKRFTYLSEDQIKALASQEARALIAWELAHRDAKARVLALVAFAAGLGLVGAWGLPW